MPLPVALKLLREKKGISARTLSVSAGLSSSYVSKVEAGALEPSFSAFCRMAKVLGMTTSEILFLVDQESNAL
jgi:transcriptional regulator with XRE-family HTH domain